MTTDEHLDCPTEEDVFRLAAWDYIEPIGLAMKLLLESMIVIPMLGEAAVYDEWVYLVAGPRRELSD